MLQLQKGFLTSYESIRKHAFNLFPVSVTIASYLYPRDIQENMHDERAVVATDFCNMIKSLGFLS